MRVSIRDPQGLIHCLELHPTALLGWENIAHGFDSSVRRRVMEEVMIAVQLKQEQLPHGYSYVPQDHH